LHYVRHKRALWLGVAKSVDALAPSR
jgi:hypothetical protein